VSRSGSWQDHAARARSFSVGADRYAAVRPSYPADAVSWLLGGDDGADGESGAGRIGSLGAAGLSDPRKAGSLRVLDLAAGTGKLTKALVAHGGFDVVAVEPSEPMLAQLRAALPSVESHIGTAEAIPLPDASVDAVVCGQAWHWFDEKAAAAEEARVLKPGGTVGIIWNDRDESVDWVARFNAIIHQGDQLEPDALHRAPRLGSTFGPVQHRTFTWVDVVPTASLRPLAASRSYLLTLPSAKRDALLAQIDQLVATHPALKGRESVPLPYHTNAYRSFKLG